MARTRATKKDQNDKYALNKIEKPSKTKLPRVRSK